MTFYGAIYRQKHKKGEQKMKYFEVCAKCGHVGRGYYYEGHFFITANSKKDASSKVKHFPRVKKDHEDVILWVEEICEDAFNLGVEETTQNPYFRCRNKQEQNAVIELIRDKIFPETESQLNYREHHLRLEDRDKVKVKGIRNPYKYAKYNRVDKIDYAWA